MGQRPGQEVNIVSAKKFAKLDGVKALPKGDQKKCHAYTNLNTGQIFVRDTGDAKKNESLISHEVVEVQRHRSLSQMGHANPGQAAHDQNPTHVNLGETPPPANEGPRENFTDKYAKRK